MNLKFEIETLYLRLLRALRGDTALRFWTSDLHFSHTNVITYCKRPFKDSKEMNAALIRRWNAMVGPQDTVMCLGDFSMSTNRMRDVAPLLNGKKFLVPGNHDRVFFSNKDLKKYVECGWEVLEKQIMVYVGRYLVRASHMPYADEISKEYDKRYFEFRPVKGNEDVLLHGHQHCKYVKMYDRIDVGIDHNFRLYSDADIIKLIEGRGEVKSRLDGSVSVHGEAM